MSQIVMSNPNKPTTMRLRMTYNISGGQFTLTKLEGCRTDGYSTHSNRAGNIIYVNVAGTTKNLSPIGNNVAFPASSAYRTMWEGSQSWSCVGTVSVKVTFSTTNTNINNSSFSTSVTVPNPATKPTGCWCSVNSRTETSASLSGGYSSNGGASVTSSGFQYSRDGSNWSNCGSNPSGLEANKTYYFRYYAGNSVGTSYSGNASITMYNWPHITSAPSFTIGNELKIQIYNPLGRSCKITVVGNNGDSMVGGTITDGSISPFNNSDWCDFWYKTLPDSTNGKYKAILDSAVGGQRIYSESDLVYYNINTNDSNFRPIFTSNNIIDVTNSAYTDISGTDKFIKGHNNLSGVIKPMSPQRKASGKYYMISASGLTSIKKDYSSSSNIIFNLGNMVTNSFNVTATDSRELSSAPVNVPITFIDYSKPYANTSKISRQSGIGTKAELEFTGKYTNWSGLLKSNIINSMKYRIGNSGDFKDFPASAIKTSSGGNWSLNATLDDTFEVTSQYELYLQIQDLLETVTLGPFVISTADAFIWKDLANKRVGVNKKPTKPFDVSGDTNIDGALYINGVKVLWYE